MFTEKVCRKWLLGNVRACNGSVHLRYDFHYLTGQAESIFRDVLNLGNRSKTMVVLSLGMHESLNHGAVISKVMSPLLSRMAAMNLTWPKLFYYFLYTTTTTDTTSAAATATATTTATTTTATSTTIVQYFCCCCCCYCYLSLIHI